jgi:hypothetical protein
MLMGLINIFIVKTDIKFVLDMIIVHFHEPRHNLFSSKLSLCQPVRSDLASGVRRY